VSTDLDPLRMVLAMLSGAPTATPAEVDRAVDAVLGVWAAQGLAAPERAALVREVEASVSVWQAPSRALVDQKGHVEWLAARRGEITWRFWDRYRRWQEDVELKPRAVIHRLDDDTDDILSKLEDPTRDGPWDRRGLVVGHVQSGKTSNYTGLICKAADAGYKLVIVLAGIHNSLRAQTQLRLDEGFLGFDSQRQRRADDGGDNLIGVGRVPGFDRLRAASLTSSVDSGDFRKAVATQLNLPIGDYPVVLVVKKNASILKNVREWVTDVEGRTDADTGRRVVPDVRLLLIDDEADNASINTSKVAAAHDPDTDPTAINRGIRELLEAFDHSSYVGYTATPFANIYSQAKGRHEKYGKDIFPESFIQSLAAPSNYSGPTRFFGVGPEETEPLPVHRVIADSDPWVPANHKKDWIPGTVPGSLVRALHAFVLSGAVRRARGQGRAHHSMLIHVTRFQDVQGRVTDQVREELRALHDRLRYGDGDHPEPLLETLRALWEQDFVPTTAWFPGDEASRMAWDDISGHLLPAAAKIQLRTMNGAAKDALEYYDNRHHGLSVVAIGGDKLSRGLTLEGLTVSYYLRASRMYDTLMQMGRWFGYRPGYEDVCRLYTTTDLYDWYRETTESTEELRTALEEMAARNGKPDNYGLQVRQSAAGLAITAANKMRRAEGVRLSFSGKISETILFDVRPETLKENLQAVERLVAACEEAAPGTWDTGGRGDVRWSGLSGTVLADFLARYRGDPKQWRVRPDLIAAYIRRCVVAGELDDCTVMVVDNRRSTTTPHQLLGRNIGLTERGLLAGERAELELRQDSRYRIRRVLSPPDELVDLDPQQWQAALADTVRDRKENKPDGPAPKAPGGDAARRHRRPSQALLVVYLLDHQVTRKPVTEHAPTAPMAAFAVSFPHSRRDTGADYKVNEVWQEQYFSDPDPDEDTA
jgi:hypothetical protein